MKFFYFQVVYKTDGLVLNMLKLAQSGNSFVTVIGELEWKCRDIGPGSPLPYTSDESYMVRNASTYFTICLQPAEM